MVSPRFYGPIGAISLLAAGWVCLIAFDPDGRSQIAEYLGLGYLFGTLFGHATLAAAWTALGPLRWYWRLSLSLAWLVVLWLGVVCNIAVHGGPEEILLLLGACLLGQWLLVQAPLWGVALGYRLSLRHQLDRDVESERAKPMQFAIRELMILTAIVAVVLGMLRALILLFADSIDDFTNREAPIFVFLAIAAVVMTLPLLLAALLPRLAVPATVIVLVLIALGTLAELPLMRLLPSMRGPDFWHFTLINAFTSVWILAIVGVMRLGGYGLGAGSEGVRE